MTSPCDGFDVLDVCHRQMLFSLGRLAALTTRLGVFGHDKEARDLAREILAFFSETVRRHHEDEERHVFPRLLERGGSEVVQTVLRLQRDHDWLEEEWMALEPQLAAVAAARPPFDLDMLREGVATFTALLHDHIALEESLVYPQARTALGAVGRRAMGREMAARRRAERAQGSHAGRVPA
jgi:hemerythrin-like domain-containing protein